MAQDVFRNLDIFKEILVTGVTGMNKYELCYALCSHYAKGFLAEASTGQEEDLAAKWHRECFRSCDNY